MRIEKFIPFRPTQGPTRSGSVYESFSGEQFDIFLFDGAIYVCEKDCIMVCGPSGIAYVGPEAGKGLIAGFNKRAAR